MRPEDYYLLAALWHGALAGLVAIAVGQFCGVRWSLVVGPFYSLAAFLIIWGLS